MNPQTLNQKAEQLLQSGDFKDALSTFQQVFLSHGKSEDAATQIEVARALRGAIYALQQQGHTDKAAQILATLERRFGQSSEKQVRRYLELARAGEADFTSELSASPSNFDADGEEDAPDDDFDLSSIEAQLSQARPSAPAASGEAAPARAPRMIPEEQVSLARIEGLFEDAFFKCESSEEWVRVQTDGPGVYISINEPNQLLHFSAQYGMRKYVEMADKFALCNALNDKYILIRAAIKDDTTLVIDAYLPYGGGALPLHIVTMVRLMARVIPAALGECDEDDILT